MTDQLRVHPDKSRLFLHQSHPLYIEPEQVHCFCLYCASPHAIYHYDSYLIQRGFVFKTVLISLRCLKFHNIGESIFKHENKSLAFIDYKFFFLLYGALVPGISCDATSNVYTQSKSSFSLLATYCALFTISASGKSASFRLLPTFMDFAFV